MTEPVIRIYRDNDLDFIEASWIKSFRSGFVRFLPKDSIGNGEYYTAQRNIIKDIFSSPAFMAVVAVTHDYDDAILGWAVSEITSDNSILHFIYVKQAFRGFGIGKSLLKSLRLESPITHSHSTKAGDNWFARMQIKGVLNPRNGVSHGSESIRSVG